MKILNLGCGNKTSESPSVINVDWSIYLRMKKNPILVFLAPAILNAGRLEKFESLPRNIKVHNLAKGIPFENDSIDAVYHSHFLEHLERQVAKNFLLEIKRVLKPGGILRIVVPDFESACKDYLAHIVACETDLKEVDAQDNYIASIIEQSVRGEAHGTSLQNPLRRFFENLILGDARKRGEVHQWMYDRFSLRSILLNLGFKDTRVQTYNRSLIPDWNEYLLDLKLDGQEYKPGSLYMETIK